MQPQYHPEVRIGWLRPARTPGGASGGGWACNSPFFVVGPCRLACGAMDRTLVICKPDAVERGLVGEIIGRFERKGFTLVAADLRIIDAETAGRHYAEHEGKPFYPELVAFIGRSPALVFVLEGPEDTWK